MRTLNTPDLPLKRESLDLVDDALYRLPLAPVPPELAADVLAQVRRLPRHGAPRLKLSWLDYALGLFVMGMGTLLALAVASLPAVWLMESEQLVRAWRALVPDPTMIASMAVGVALCSALLAGAGVLLRRAPD